MRRLLARAAALVLAAGCTTDAEPPGPLQPTPAADGGTSEDAEVPDAGEPEPRDAGIVEPTDAGGPRYTWWQDVQPIVADRCGLCHGETPLFGAPMALAAWADTHQSLRGTPAHEVMVFRIYANQNRMPPPSQPQLTDEERAVVRAWSEAGAPEGTPPTDAGVNETRDGGSEAPDGGAVTRPVSRSFELRAQAAGGGPYAVPVGDTNYTCFAMRVPAGMGTEHAFRFEPLLDNLAHNHHMLVFKNNGSAANETAPFECAGLPLQWEMIAGWAPGRGADEIPSGAGVPLAAGDQLILQVHYDQVRMAGLTDTSGYRMVLTDEPDLTPAGMLWSGVMWGGSLNGTNVTRQGECTLSSDITMFAVFPHRHQVGTRITLELRRAGESSYTNIVDITGWSFTDQPNIPVPPQYQQLRRGDRLRTTCWWNTGGRSVRFGEASDDEMCFNFIYHYPKIGSQFACVSLQP